MASFAGCARGRRVPHVVYEPCKRPTELSIRQKGVPAAIPAEMCYLGWQQSLSLLALPVEAELPAA
jgi:hypothetical protein